MAADTADGPAATPTPAPPPPPEPTWDVLWCLDAWHDLYACFAAALPPWARLRMFDPAAGTLASQCSGAAVLIPTTGPVNGAAIAAAGPSLRLIAQPASGTDNIDLAAARSAGVPVVACRSVNADACAEAAVMGLLMAARRYPELAESVAARRIGSPPGVTLRGKRLGIVGISGAIGSRVAHIARAMGMEVSGLDSQTTTPSTVAALLAACDAVSLHCTLTPATRHLIDEAALRGAKPGLILVNFSRGAVVDEAALLAALQAGRVGAAALDVFEAEPVDPACPLATHPRVVALPHCGVATVDVYDEYATRLVAAMACVRAGRAADLADRVA
jgi:glyoxylate reductase